MSDTKRLSWIDIAKGISIILVVMMHSAYGVGAETGETGFLHWIIAFATPFRMPEFFLISGLFLSQVIGRDWTRFADRRIVHYLYFYALWAVLQILFKVALVEADPMAALSAIAWAVIEPYGVLWFIYMLAIFSAVSKLLHTLKVPHWAALAAGAALQIAPAVTPSLAINEFTEYFVYFYAGYALAPMIFKTVAYAMERPLLALGAIAVWAVANGLLVFSSGYQVLPDHTEMGLAALPGLRLALALIGSMALCVTAGLLSKLAFMDWLRWFGANSIVIYLSFSIPMGVTRVVLLKLGFITDTGLLSFIVLSVALVSPLVLYLIIQKTGWGKFLFERPKWAHLPGAPGSKKPQLDTARVPAE